MDIREWWNNPFPVRACDLLQHMPFWMFANLFGTIQKKRKIEQMELWPLQWDLALKLDVRNRVHPHLATSWHDVISVPAEGEIMTAEQLKLIEQVLFLAKSRQVGGSEVSGLYALFTALRLQNSETLIFSMNEKEVEKFLAKRIAPKARMLEQINATDKHGRPCIIWPKIQINRLDIKIPEYDGREQGDKEGFGAGSLIEGIPSNPDAGSGRNLTLGIMDEAEKMDDAAGSIYENLLPTLEDDPDSQLLVLSSGQKPGTWFLEMVRRIHEKKSEGIDLHFLPYSADPKRDAKWKEVKKNQYADERDFISAFPSSIEELLSSKEGKVFPHFDAKFGGVHVMDFEVQAAGCHFYTGIDDGKTTAYVMAAYDYTEDRLDMFDELYLENGVEISRIGELIKAKHQLWNFKYKAHLCDTSLFSNHQYEKTKAEVLEEVSGLRFTGAYKKDSEGTREMLSKRLSDRKIRIHPRCKGLIQNLRDWGYANNGKPEKRNDHAIDPTRYICADIKQLIQSQTKPKFKQEYSGRRMRDFRDLIPTPYQGSGQFDWLSH
ncbi:MAG: hypothetical protein VXB01_02565 [Opitutae bacterium]